MSDRTFTLHSIGLVESSLVDCAAAPKHGNQGSPGAWLAFDGEFVDGFATWEPAMRSLWSQCSIACTNDEHWLYGRCQSGSGSFSPG